MIALDVACVTYEIPLMLEGNFENHPYRLGTRFSTLRAWQQIILTEQDRMVHVLCCDDAVRTAISWRKKNNAPVYTHQAANHVLYVFHLH